MNEEQIVGLAVRLFAVFQVQERRNEKHMASVLRRP